MSYFSYFYSKNVFNICIFIFLGFVIAIVDVKGREIIKKIVGARVSAGYNTTREGLENKNDGGGGCPQDCKSVETMKKRMEDLIDEGMKLRSRVIENEKTIESQAKMIKSLQENTSKMGKV
jgi:hypothetical protein